MVAIIIGTIGVVVALASLILGIYYFRAGRRRNCLSFSTKTQPLILSRSQTVRGALKVTFQDQKLDDPYLVTVVFENDGPKDIKSADFDQNKPLTVSVGGRIVSLFETADLDVSIRDNTLIDVQPALLAVGSTYILNAIVDGKASPRLRGSLIDTTIIERAQTRPTSGRSRWEFPRIHYAAAASIVVGLVATVTVGTSIFFIPHKESQEEHLNIELQNLRAQNLLLADRYIALQKDCRTHP